MRVSLVVALFLVGVHADAQSPPSRWVAGIDVQHAEIPLPATSAGLHLSATLLSKGLANVAIGITGYDVAVQGAGIVCVLVSADGRCDTRRVSRYGEIGAILRLGRPSEAPSPVPFVLAAYGAYATRWGEGKVTLGSQASDVPASDASPHGSYLAGGIGWWLPPSGFRWRIELTAKRYASLSRYAGRLFAFNAGLSRTW